MPIFQDNLGKPVPECLHSGFYWSKGRWRWWGQQELQDVQSYSQIITTNKPTPMSTFSALGVFHVMRYINVRYLLTYLLTQIFMRQMPFLSPNQHCQNNAGEKYHILDFLTQVHLGSTNPLFDHKTLTVTLRGGLPSLLSAL